MPSVSALPTHDGSVQILAEHETLGRYHLTCEGTPELLFTGNETNHKLLFESSNVAPYLKDAFHEYVVHGRTDAVKSEARRHQVRRALSAHRSGRRSIGDSTQIVGRGQRGGRVRR
jgi:hypothetical protein